MTPIVLDICCGIGGASEGLRQAGFEVIGIEHEPLLAAIHEANHSSTICADFRQLSPQEFARAGVSGIWISPPCQGHSRRRSANLPEREDKSLTLDFIPWLNVIEPKFLVVENVVGYEKSESIQELALALQVLGYNWRVYCSKSVFQNGWLHPQYWDDHIHWAGKPLNAKDFGVAQDRERVFLVALRDRPVPSLFPEDRKLIGWKEALGSIIYDLPESQLTLAQHQAWAKAKTDDDVIIQRVAYNKTPMLRRSIEQVWTLTAHLCNDGKKTKDRFGGSRNKVIDVLLNGDNPYSLTIPALGVLSGFSKYYRYSGRAAVDMTGIGNCVPSPVARAIGEQIKRQF